MRSFSTLIVVICLGGLLPLHEAFTNPRIVGGTDATRRYRRPMALLRIFFEGGQVAGCTATVIHSQWLLTAAHCVTGSSRSGPTDTDHSYAIIGESNPLASGVNADRPVIFFKSVIVHARFTGGLDYRFDIALIQLKEAIPSRDYYPITIRSPPPPETVVKAVGYGTVGEREGFPDEIQMANVVVKDTRECAEEENERVRRYLSQKRMVCAVSVGYPHVGKTDTCYGDSGGPLFFKRNGRVFQFAITSFSPNRCAMKGGRAYYTRLDTYKSSIKRIIRNGGNVKGWMQIA